MEKMIIKPIEHKKKANLVFERIIELIRDNDLKKGDTIPSQTEISKKLKVGIQAIREGYSSLEMSGIIKTKGGFGTVVDTDNINFFVKPKVFNNLKTKSEIIDCFDILKVIEKESYILCALNADKDDLHSIESALKLLNHEYKSKNIYSLDLDRKFHLEVANASKNKILVDLFEYLWMISDKNVEFWQDLIDGKYEEIKDFTAKDFEFNNQIFINIKNKDILKIKKLTSSYHNTLRDMLVNFL
jgi:GntR family transcriptional regulator, transcriptional repressor for pyruvate dehydrogenase complex